MYINCADEVEADVDHFNGVRFNSRNTYGINFHTTYPLFRKCVAWSTSGFY